MFKPCGVFEVVKEDRNYKLLLPENCNLGELHDVLFQMRSFVIEKITAAQKADEDNRKSIEAEQQQEQPV